MRLSWLLSIGLVCTYPVARAQRLHIVYAYEQRTLDYGLVNLENDTLMTEVMQTVAIGLNSPLNISYVPRDNFTRAGLRKTIDALRTTPNDVIILYYSGYGLTPTSNTVNFSNWKLADVPTQGLPVSEVEGWLAARKVRLSLIIADCSVQSGQLFRVAPRVRAMILPGPDLRKKIIQRLFRSTCGVVKLGSALPSVPTWVNAEYPGSVFTGSFHRAFGQLLQITDPSALPTVSFQQLKGMTETNMNDFMRELPFAQKPVLEQRSCLRATAPVIDRPTVDPNGNETLSGLLTAFALTRDTLERTRLQRQLFTRIRPNAVVDVSRIGSDTVLADFTARLTFEAYLGQVRRPPGIGQGNAKATLMGRLNSIALTSKSTSMPIDSLNVQEYWLLGDIQPRRKE